MAKMTKLLDLLSYSDANSLEEIKRILNENNRRLQDAYKNTYNDIMWKEFVYFTVGMKRWRMGPLVGYHPGRDSKSATEFVIQELVGTNWRNQASWGAAAGGAETSLHGGEQEDE